MEKNLEYYMQLPYTLELIKDPDPAEPWFVRVKELHGCMSHGDTPGEAVSMIREAQELWLEGMLEEGLPIPEPAEPFPVYSGKFVVRVPQSLHRKLAEQAEHEGVSLNAFVTTVLAEAVGYRRAMPQPTYTMPATTLQAQPAIAETQSPYQSQADESPEVDKLGKGKRTRRTRTAEQKSTPA